MENSFDFLVLEDFVHNGFLAEIVLGRDIPNEFQMLGIYSICCCHQPIPT